MQIVQTNNIDYKRELIDLYIEAFSSGLSRQYIDLEELNQYIDALLLNGYALMAFENKKLLGAILICPLAFDKSLPDEIRKNFSIEKCVYVAEMMVAEEARGQGIGKKLLNRFFDTVDRLRYSDAFIRVWDQNVQALSLYGKMGFERIASIEQTKIKADGSETFVMQKIYLHKKLEQTMHEFLTKTIDLNNGTPETKRQEILTYFEKTWAIDEKLYTQLKSDEVFYHRGDPLRHVLLFYLGHTAAFFINKMMLAKIIDTRINPEFESIFAIGVDEMSWDDLNEKHYNWPTVDAVREYRRKVKQLVTEKIKNTILTLPISWNDPFWIILMGIEHERIHLETSSVLIRQLPLEEVVSGLFGTICGETALAPENEFLPVPAAELHMGKPSNHPLYGWDNEYGNYVEKISEFKTTKYLISNGEFLAFVDAGGYNLQEFWTEEGWNWRIFKKSQMPLFWRKEGDRYRLRLVAEEIAMPWNWPVEVNYLEAKAYCNWKSKQDGKLFRLPTEAEWIRLRDYCEVPDVLEWETAPGNINLEHFASPCPVDRFSNAGFYDVTGNVWQWTETPITGYPGFKVHPLYDDFTTPTFDGQHNVLKGGSWISTGNEATRHARYAFRRHFYQHAGFRMVESNAPLALHKDEYETDTEVSNSCEANWGDAFSTPDNFSKQLALIAFETMNNRSDMQVLDLNADTGRLAFELAAHFEKVTALDFSARFIRLSIQLQEKGFIRYIVKDEGELVFYREVVLSDFKLDKNKDRILFMQADANNLKPLFSGYDLIIVPNLLEELICPILFLNQIHERLNEHGVLIIASTYEWDDIHTRPEHWPGGFKKDGEPLTSFEGIQNILGELFILEKTPVNIPLMIRKSSRIVEQRLSEVSVWRKK